MKLVNFLMDPTFSEGVVEFFDKFGESSPIFLAILKVLSIFTGSMLIFLIFLMVLTIGFIGYRVVKLGIIGD